MKVAMPIIAVLILIAGQGGASDEKNSCRFSPEAKPGVVDVNCTCEEFWRYIYEYFTFGDGRYYGDLQGSLRAYEKVCGPIKWKTSNATEEKAGGGPVWQGR